MPLIANHPRKKSWPAAVTALSVVFFSGCGFLGPNEEYRQEKGRTVYRTANHSGEEESPSTLSQKKVPGE
jgi:hypothetical protein